MNNEIIEYVCSYVDEWIDECNITLRLLLRKEIKNFPSSISSEDMSEIYNLLNYVQDHLVSFTSTIKNFRK